jgi:hypothetical protein
MNEPPAARRAIYDEDLQVRIDAAMARTRRFIMSTQAIRASGKVQETARTTSVRQALADHLAIFAAALAMNGIA